MINFCQILTDFNCEKGSYLKLDVSIFSYLLPKYVFHGANLVDPFKTKFKKTFINHTLSN